MVPEHILTGARQLQSRFDAALRESGLYPENWARPGLSEADIAVEERRLGVQLPSEYKAIYSLFNGFGDIRLDLVWEGESHPGFHLNPLGKWRDSEQTQFISSEMSTLQREYQDQIRAHGTVKPVVWDPNWVPLTFPSAWYSWYADFSDVAAGSYGQVILVKLDADATRYDVSVVANDFFEFIELMIESVKAPADDW